jgi:hypothetical protein
MKMIRNTRFLLLILVILIIIPLRCKKDDHQNKIQYDLFPIKVGNEYYYHHEYSYHDYFTGYDTIGIEKWTVIVDSKKNNQIEYLIETKFNGIYVNWSSLQSDTHRDTTFNIVKTSHFLVTERSSGELLFWDITIPRYSDKADTTIRIWLMADHSESYYFKADLGLTNYYKSFDMLESQIRESLIQDSVKISR